jgi:alcohol oxidase
LFLSISIADVKPLIWAYKFTREIARRLPLFRGEVASMHPKFPEGSGAALVEDGQPFSMDAPKLVYLEEDNKAIEKYTREFCKRIVSYVNCHEFDLLLGM